MKSVSPSGAGRRASARLGYRPATADARSRLRACGPVLAERCIVFLFRLLLVSTAIHIITKVGEGFHLWP